MLSVLKAKHIMDEKRRKAEQKAHNEELAQIAGEGASKKDFGSRFNRGVGQITDAPVHPEFDIPTRLSVGSLAESYADEEKVRGCWSRTKIEILEQRIHGSTPLLTVSKTLVSLTAFSLLCFVFGIVLLASAARVSNNSIAFGGLPSTGSRGVVEVTLDSALEAPWFVHLNLKGYYQNMRTYMIDRDNQQLTSGNPGDGSACIHLKESDNDNRVTLPCGLIARSTFNDTMQLQYRRAGETSWSPLELSTSGDDFLPDSFLDMKNPPADWLDNDRSRFWQEQDFWLIYRYPPQVCLPTRALEASEITTFILKNRTVSGGGKTYTVPACSGYGGNADSVPGYASLPNPDGWGLENRHFQVWMNTAAVPNFLKLWGEASEPLSENDEVRLVYQENYPIQGADFHKALVLSNPNWQGGHNLTLGIGLVLIGLLYQAWACYIFLKNKKSPRVFGDAKLFNFSANPSHMAKLEAQTIKAGKKMAHRAKEGLHWLSEKIRGVSHTHSSAEAASSQLPAPVSLAPPTLGSHGVATATRQSIS